MKEKKAEAKASWLDALRERWAAVGVSLSLAVMLAGGGMVAASGDSLPGDFLYSFKLAGEQVLLSFSFGDEAKAETYARLADERVDEIVQLAAKSDVANMEEATRRLDGYLASITSILSPPKYSADNAADGAFPPMAEDSESYPRDILLNVGPGDDLAGAAGYFELLMRQYGLEQVNALEQALETAPQESRDALEHALVVILNGYRDILEAAD
jgi:hypothetical protein